MARHKAECQRYLEKYSNGSLAFYEYVNKKKNQRNLQKPKTRAWLSATRDFLFYACLLALSHSGRHERTTLCTSLLCAGPIEGCSGVLAVRGYYGFRSLVCASWCSEEEKHVQKQKLRCLCSLEGHIASRADDTARFQFLREEHLPSTHVHLAVGTPQCHDLDCEKRLCRELATLAQKHTRAVPAACFCYVVAVRSIAVGSGAATTIQLAAYSPVLCLSSSLVTKKRKKKRTSQEVKKASNFGKVLFPNN